jgi:hypothetical protein
MAAVTLDSMALRLAVEAVLNAAIFGCTMACARCSMPVVMRWLAAVLSR